MQVQVNALLARGDSERALFAKWDAGAEHTSLQQLTCSTYASHQVNYWMSSWPSLQMQDS